MNCLSESTLKYIKQQDERLDRGWHVPSKDLERYARNLIEFGMVEVGHRACCGSTHRTQKTHDAWIRVLKKIRKDGFVVKEEVQKHKNAYATNNGGFWNSTIYSTEKMTVRACVTGHNNGR